MSAITRSVLTPILQLWLRSQVDSLQQLKVEMLGSDRQIWQGNIPQAKVSGKHLVYQGLHISQVNLTAANIQLNTPQLLKGESLRLLEAIAVNLDLTLDAPDLWLCLSANLVSEILPYQLAPDATDSQIQTLLEHLLKNLGEEFQLTDLIVKDGNCHCQGIFTVAAT
jgi:hypothetical protein